MNTMDRWELFAYGFGCGVFVCCLLFLLLDWLFTIAEQEHHKQIERKRKEENKNRIEDVRP